VGLPGFADSGTFFAASPLWTAGGLPGTADTDTFFAASPLWTAVGLLGIADAETSFATPPPWTAVGLPGVDGSGVILAALTLPATGAETGRLKNRLKKPPPYNLLTI
jgi:hypothetical protein